MSDPNPKEEKHPTAATTSQPHEEFIEQKARPSEDVSELATEAPPEDSATEAPPKGRDEK